MPLLLPEDRVYSRLIRVRMCLVTVEPGRKIHSQPANRVRTNRSLSLAVAGGRIVTTKDTKSTKMEFDELSNRVIGRAIEVHRHLGPGLLESAYDNAWPMS